MNRAQVLEAIAARGMSHLLGPLKQVLRPAIRVRVAKTERARGIGSSRFGGAPDLPAKSAWPKVDGIPLMFAGQINLEDVARFKAAHVLPKTGLLSFFFDGMLTGYERGEPRDRSRVIYTNPSKSKLVRLAAPASVPTRFEEFEEAGATFASEWTLPHLEEIDGEEFPTIPPIVPILRTIKDRRGYLKLRREVRGKHIGSKLLGHADAVQGGEIRFGVVTKRDQEKRFRYENYEWTHVEKLVSEMRDTELLFQSAMGVTWGGSGVVYFWIRRQDLENARFDRVFATMEST